MDNAQTEENVKYLRQYADEHIRQEITVQADLAYGELPSQRLDVVYPAQRAQAMRRVNPRHVARNHRVEEALAAASDRGELGPFEALLQAVRRPYDDDPALDRYAEPAPAGYTERYRTFCGT